MKGFVKQVKQLHDFDIDIDGDISEIIEDPKAWATKIAEQMIIKNAKRISAARKLGEEWNNMSEAERLPYKKFSDKDRQRYA